MLVAAFAAVAPTLPEPLGSEWRWVLSRLNLPYTVERADGKVERYTSTHAYALEQLPKRVPQIQLYGPLDPELRGGVVPFNLPGIHPHDVAQVLDRSGIAVRAGHHCTMQLHERLDLAATARASFNVYTTKADIDALADGLLDVLKVFGS